MCCQRLKLLDDFLFFFYALFIFGSTFSIALAQIALGVSLLLFIVVATVRRYNPFPKALRWFYVFVGLYILWMLIASLTGRTPLRSALILKEEWLFCAVPIGVYLLAKEKYRQKLLTTFAAGVALFSFYGVLQMFTGVHWFKSAAPNPGAEFGWVIKGNFPSPMTFGNYFATTAGFFVAYALTGWKQLERNHKLLLGPVCILGVIAVLGSYNRGAILGLVVGVILLGILLRHRKMLLGLGAAIAVSIVVVMSAASVRDRIVAHFGQQLDPAYEGGRVFIWNNSLKITAANPVFGVGQGNFRDEYVALVRPDIDPIRIRVHAHNDFLNIAAISGIPGMIFFIGLWWTFCARAGRGWRQSRDDPRQRQIWMAAIIGSAVFLVSSLTEATFADEEVRQMLMFVWAVGLFGWYQPKLESDGNHTGTPAVKPLDN